MADAPSFVKHVLPTDITLAVDLLSLSAACISFAGMLISPIMAHGMPAFFKFFVTLSIKATVLT